MRLKLLVVVSIVAGLGLFLLGRYSGSSAHEGSAAKQILYYVDPMHPWYRSDHPGTAPDCGMALEPVYAGDDPVASLQLAPGAVMVTPRQRRLLGIQVESLEANSGPRALRTTGRVVPDENAVYRIMTGADGLILSLGDNAPGTMVKRGEVLAAFFTSELLTTQQTYVSALKTLDRVKGRTYEPEQSFRLAEQQLQVSEGELRVLGMGDAQLREVTKSREFARDIRITSPADGLVLSRAITSGQRLEQGEELYRIADLARVWILADLPNDFPAPSSGDVVRVNVPAVQRILQATVSRAVPLFDPSSRSLKLRLETANPGFHLRPDMFVDVELTAPAPSGLSVPMDAIIHNGKRKIAYVESSENLFEPRVVETGAVYGDHVVIERGLAAGERVVTAGNFMIDSESRMKGDDAR